jgi:hypothetical protein
MNKKIIKNLVAFAILAFLAVPAFVSAQGGTTGGLDVGIDRIKTAGIGLGEEDPRDVATNLINTAMLFLGLIAVGIVLIGGFKWMTAGGNEDKVSEAKKLMGAGIVGLLIILAAWGVTIYLFGALGGATGSNVDGVPAS